MKTHCRCGCRSACCRRCCICCCCSRCRCCCGCCGGGASCEYGIAETAPDPVQALEKLGIVVEDSDQLRQLLRECPELVTLLRGVAMLFAHRAPQARLRLTWYVDPEIEGDEHPVLVARLPSYDGDERVRAFLETILDANQVLAASPEWILATTDFCEARENAE